MNKKIFISILIFTLFALINTQAQTEKDKEENKKITKPKVTFIELGSVNCVPCRMMQSVMKNVEEKYGSQVKIIFYDVWTQEQKPYAKKYDIKLIPTQVFLDKDGKEFHRHEGYYPEKEIDKILQDKGLKPKNEKS